MNEDKNRFFVNVYTSNSCDDCDCHSCDGSCHCECCDTGGDGDGDGSCNWG